MCRPRPETQRHPSPPHINLCIAIDVSSADKQTSGGDWRPASVSEWRPGGMAYRPSSLSLIVFGTSRQSRFAGRWTCSKGHVDMRQKIGFVVHCLSITSIDQLPKSVILIFR
jgi:hypothetical protein